MVTRAVDVLRILVDAAAGTAAYIFLLLCANADMPDAVRDPFVLHEIHEELDLKHPLSKEKQTSMD